MDIKQTPERREEEMFIRTLGWPWWARYTRAAALAVGIVLVFVWLESERPRAIWLAWLTALCAGLYAAALAREATWTVIGLAILWGLWFVISWVFDLIGLGGDSKGSSALLILLGASALMYVAHYIENEFLKLHQEIASLRTHVERIAEASIEVGERHHREVMRAIRPTPFD
jgi:fatty acid desaturase